MTTVLEWLAGARPRTLPAAVAPVLVGSGAAYELASFDIGPALLALVVSLALQVGVNYANDYSDGIRGTDAIRVGPMRLVGSGTATPRAVKLAAFAAFGVAGLAGLALAALSSWWLLAFGAAAIAAAWFYTGGPRPYGYAGLGELFVFAFFGLLAVLGTTYVQAGRVSVAAWAGAIAIGLLACALLMVNNLRDISTDATSGKRTLAVRLGNRNARALLLAVLAAAFLCLVAIVPGRPWTLLTLAAVPLAVVPWRLVSSGASGPLLIQALAAIGRLEIGYALLLTLGLVLSRG